MDEYSEWFTLVLASYAVYSTYSDWKKLTKRAKIGRGITLAATIGFSAALFGLVTAVPVGFAGYIVGVKAGRAVMDKITQRRMIMRGEGPDEDVTEGNGVV